MYKSIIGLIICSCLILNATAAKKPTKKTIRFPVSCKLMGYKYDLYNVIFTPSNKKYSQTAYFIHNISNRTIYMLQVNDGSEPYIVHVDGNIDPNRWSVLAVSDHRIKYICTNYDKRNNDYRVINCHGMLDICEFPYAKFGTNHRGTYWLTLNKSRKAAVRTARWHGVLLVDRKQTE